jgi:hypothetical protein
MMMRRKRKVDMKTDYIGIDYGLGQSNIDRANGIRFGVIPVNEVSQAWCDSSEPAPTDPSCPNCGHDGLVEFDADAHAEYKDADKRFPEYACDRCELALPNDDVWPESCDGDGYAYTDDGYACESDSHGDIFITRSKFYTFAQFCSPCAPGACYLLNALEPDNGARAYCFDHTWFEDGKAPYRVFRVSNDTEVLPV